MNGKILNRQPHSNIATASSQWLGLWREFGVLAESFRPDPWAAVSYNFDKNGALSWHWEPEVFGLEDSGSPGPLYRTFQQLRTRFEALAVRAGVKLGSEPVPNDARDYWLHYVFADLLGLPSGNVIERGGSVENVCEVCAAFCSRLQAKAFAKAFAAENAVPRSARHSITVRRPAPPRSIAEQKPAGASKLTEREENIWNVIQRRSKGHQYCRELDGANIRIQRTGVWRGAPSNYADAYDAGKPWRHRIENEKSKIKQKAKLAKLATKLAGE